MLTKKQYQLLQFIEQRVRETGVAPSFDEMKKALSLKSKSGIHRLITALEERGFVRRLPYRARALEIIKLPDGPDNMNSGAGLARQDDDRRENVLRPNFGGQNGGGPEVVELPLYGRIAAGSPIEALRDPGSFISLPSSLIGSSGDFYALEVDGDSMIEAGIQDDDIVVIERVETAENGSIVVALVDESEVTLKRYRSKGGSVALEPANKNFETRIFPPDRVRIQGRLVGLFRRY